MKELAYITTYTPDEESLGGASWVDRRIIDALRTTFNVHVHYIANRAGVDERVRLEVRGDPSSMVRTVRLMTLRSEPYFSAKFRGDPNWRKQVESVRAIAKHSPAAIIVTSQLPALLAARDGGVTPNLHIAHNVDTILAQEHDPMFFRTLRNARRMEKLERQILSLPHSVATLSTRDADRLYNWGIHAEPWPLATGKVAPKPRAGRIGFLGKGTWPPNISAIEYLVNEVIPLVRNTMGLNTPKVVIAGRGTSKWQGVSGVDAVGEVDSAADFYQSVDIIAVPRMGNSTGISVKMLEAVSNGIPVIVPPELAADAGLTSGFLPAGSAEETAEQIVKFYAEDVADQKVSTAPESNPDKRIPNSILRSIADSQIGQR